MNRLQSRSCQKTFKFNERRSLSSSKKDYEVFSLSELNELENWETELGGTADNLHLYTSNDGGDVSRKFQQADQRLSILQHGNPLDDLPSDFVIDVQPKASVVEKEEAPCLFASADISEPLYESESNVRESISTKAIIRDYIETFTSTLIDHNELQSSTCFNVFSTKDISGNTGFAHGQKDDDDIEKHQNQSSSEVASHGCDNRDKEHANWDEFLV
ncbi:hypothetical protein AVEN_6069-1 [Araneus ventricosus]|uniref:Uncharacterized protein n=1 Tax=Araneus ventricosus TaxID=182803 RepID=A0A4Y2NXA5_ARAVE|nr:hypothetical protein AVEN_6069-1 [Araneus ventricosus]